MKFLLETFGYFLYCSSKHTLWVHVRTASLWRKLGVPLQACTLQFLYIKAGFRAVYIALACFPDDDQTNRNKVFIYFSLINKNNTNFNMMKICVPILSNVIMFSNFQFGFSRLGFSSASFFLIAP